jgi:hypothetical protein
MEQRAAQPSDLGSVYEPPTITVHGTMAEVTEAAHMGPSMDHHFPMNGRPGMSH